jgi:glycosyltransferase involved in cell wall biosynthesis
VRIALDAQLGSGTATGIGEYARGLAPALRARGVDVVELAAPRYDPWRFDRRVLWDQVLLPLGALRAKPDLLHCVSGTMPLLRSVPAVVTVHDVAWLRTQAHARAYARAYFGRFSVARYRGARRVLVDSAFSGRELVALTAIAADHVDVVYPGVAADVVAVRRAPDDAPFILAVGTVEVRKNLEVVIRALRDVPGVRLVSTGPPTAYQAYCARLAEDSGVADRVEFRGYVERAVLLDLYARAAVAVVPSTYEGFGYGAAWALCAGVPLVAADASSLPEVAGGAAPLVGPHDIAGWSDALGGILAGRAAAEAAAAVARAAAAARFSWEGAAERAETSYRRALGA